ncbi:uncharacterized protein LOC108899583 [Lates japonicus]|uniref:Pyrin domain-containing protein n=1 Tax=Lates japonicus TaxID=270547 RepID=A0AAD3MGJ7_LATJO|nr:uncharacterized protein AKAME5_000588000 [Lates japonicus]
MAHRTIRQAVAEALEDLTRDDFDKFCHQLRDRRGEPRIKHRDVEGKHFLDITDLLVSRFTEYGAGKVAVETLRQINCNQVAETLDSTTKALMDKGDPNFRKTSSGELETKPSQEAEKLRASQRPLTTVTVKKPEEGEAEAKACVLSKGGDPCSDQLVLSRCTIQFGQYKGQTFKWLLENDASYAANIVASHQRERVHTKEQSPLMVNKDSLTQYAMAYPEVIEEVTFQCEYEKAKERSLQPGQEGKALVGFGKYRSETLQDLYESKTSYVNFLRGKKSTCTPGSKMEDAIRYILQRDRAAAATAPSRPRAARKTRGNWVQSTRSQFTSGSRPRGRKQKRSWRRT